MSLSISTLFPRLFARFSPDDRKAFKVQIVIVTLFITLLELGYSWQREVLEIASRNHLQRIIRGWDGLAWYIWAAAAPATLILIRRYPLERGQIFRNVLRLIGGSLCIYFSITNGRYLLRLVPNIWLPDEGDLPLDWATFRHTQSVLLPLDFITYCGIFAASFAIDSFVKYRRHAQEVNRLNLKTVQLQSDLASAQLAALRGQLHPHFLFNAFNAISTLVRQHRHAVAIETIAELSGLFRLAIEHIDRPMQPLAQELKFVTCYLNVERIRFGEKLHVDLEVDPATLECKVPSLLLQPLVENAIKHGISPRISPGQIVLNASRKGDRLHVYIRNDGPEPTVQTSSPLPVGIGLANMRKRLTNVYGGDYRLDIERQGAGGALVRVELPWRECTPLLKTNENLEIVPA